MSLEKETRELEAETPDRQYEGASCIFCLGSVSFTQAPPEAQLARAACEKTLSVSDPWISRDCNERCPGKAEVEGHRAEMGGYLRKQLEQRLAFQDDGGQQVSFEFQAPGTSL